MQVDALTLAALADDLRDRLRGARIDDVIQPTPQSLALQCFGGADNGRNRWLLLSAHPQLARIHLTDGKPRKLVNEPPTFVMLLRKHVEGARLLAVRQPRWERLIELGFGRGFSREERESYIRGDAEPESELWLTLEVMGRLSNIILRDANDMTLGALRTVSLEVTGYRAIQPNTSYRYPPPQTRQLHGELMPRLTAETVTPFELRAAALDLLDRYAHPTPLVADIAISPSATMSTSKKAPTKRPRKVRKEEAPTLNTLLTAHLAGFGRDLAAESIARASANPVITEVPLDATIPTTFWDTLAARIRDVTEPITTHAWRPTLLYPSPNADQRATLSPRPFEYTVYEPFRFPDAQRRRLPNANDMLADYYEGAEWRIAIEAAKGDLHRLLSTQRDRCVRKADALRGELQALDEMARLRHEADILLAFQNEIPAHIASHTLPDPFAGSDDAATLIMQLDPRLTPIENANKKYDRYHKLQRAAQLIPPQIEANEVEHARIEQLLTDLALAETPGEISHVRAEVIEAGYIRGERDKLTTGAKAKKAPKGAKNAKGAKGQAGGKRANEGGLPLRRQSSEGFTLLVGKNSRQNETVTFHEAGPTDMWLHARGVPGAHVIVKSGGRPVADLTLHEAAALAAYYSQAREAGSVPVDYTQQRYVRHMKGGGPGMVIYEREHTLHVAPTDHGATA